MQLLHGFTSTRSYILSSRLGHIHVLALVGLLFGAGVLAALVLFGLDFFLGGFYGVRFCLDLFLPFVSLIHRSSAEGGGTGTNLLPFRRGIEFRLDRVEKTTKSRIDSRFELDTGG